MYLPIVGIPIKTLYWLLEKCFEVFEDFVIMNFDGMELIYTQE
jgi:hypothetical protein